MSDLLCAKAIELVGAYLRRAVDDGSDLEARGNMVLAATIAGVGFGSAGVHIPHALLLPDRLAQARVVAARLRRRRLRPARARVSGHGARLVPLHRADAATGALPRRCPADRRRRRSRRVVRSVSLRDVGSPSTIGELGYDEEDIPAIVEGALKQQRLLVNSPKPVDDGGARGDPPHQPVGTAQDSPSGRSAAGERHEPAMAGLPAHVPAARALALDPRHPARRATTEALDRSSAGSAHGGPIGCLRGWAATHDDESTSRPAVAHLTFVQDRCRTRSRPASDRRAPNGGDGGRSPRAGRRRSAPDHRCAGPCTDGDWRRDRPSPPARRPARARRTHGPPPCAAAAPSRAGARARARGARGRRRDGRVLRCPQPHRGRRCGRDRQRPPDRAVPGAVRPRVGARAAVGRDRVTPW